MKTFFLWVLAEIFSTIVFTPISGYMLSLAWGWFVVPVFNSAPHLSWAACVGVSMTCRFLTLNVHSIRTIPNTEVKTIADGIYIVFLKELGAIMVYPLVGGTWYL